jgi:hypothetical protein
MKLSTPLLALLTAGSLFGTVAPAPAETGAVKYRAELASPAAQNRFAVRDLVWKCAEGTACVAPQGTSRPVVECAALARQVGELRTFSVAGRALSAAELEKCNARAR